MLVTEIQRILAKVDHFETLIGQLRTPFSVDRMAPWVYRLGPKDVGTTASEGTLGDSEISIFILALVHGNEVGGLQVINDLLEFLGGYPSFLERSICIGLGNVEASRHDKRYLEKDLNRCFGSNSRLLLEEKRAAELEDVMSRVLYLLDIHQTRLANQDPFFIYPFTSKGYLFSRAIGREVPIVTHWNDSFSCEGTCSDEYLNSIGGVGITIELGQNGFDHYQRGFGFQLVINSIRHIQQLFRNDQSSLESSLADGSECGKVFVMSETYQYPEKGTVVLKPGWHNFKDVKLGEVIGYVDQKPIQVNNSGKILFAKYDPPKSIAERSNSELFRIIREVSPDNLPQDL